MTPKKNTQAFDVNTRYKLVLLVLGDSDHHNWWPREDLATLLLTLHHWKLKSIHRCYGERNHQAREVVVAQSANGNAKAAATTTTLSLTNRLS